MSLLEGNQTRQPPPARALPSWLCKGNWASLVRAQAGRHLHSITGQRDNGDGQTASIHHQQMGSTTKMNINARKQIMTPTEGWLCRRQPMSEAPQCSGPATVRQHVLYQGCSFQLTAVTVERATKVVSNMKQLNWVLWAWKL